ncbi:hypothetical protein K5E40_06860 [Pseudomonas baetica]|uniref:hypothetical protein n=1 Tax=Pseudomonas TaxID=286 RepID=UPI0012965D83|nr:MULTISPECIES: hypothetical protein [Pseudomonas]MBX9405398.1 hypothetical protein [Pseudomonas baetica]MQU56965.1 hypothetical protein [Pseudomonas helleri]
MNNQTCNTVGALPACSKKATELWYVTHPKAPKALLGPFLSHADAECGRVVMRSADAVVTACLVGSIDDIAHGHGVNNGRVCRAFAGADRSGVNHE